MARAQPGGDDETGRRAGGVAVVGGTTGGTGSLGLTMRAGSSSQVNAASTSG